MTTEAQFLTQPLKEPCNQMFYEPTDSFLQVITLGNDIQTMMGVLQNIRNNFMLTKLRLLLNHYNRRVYTEQEKKLVTNALQSGTLIFVPHEASFLLERSGNFTELPTTFEDLITALSKIR